MPVARRPSPAAPPAAPAAAARSLPELDDPAHQFLARAAADRAADLSNQALRRRRNPRHLRWKEGRDEMAEVHWTAHAECSDCGWRGEAAFEEGAVVESDHNCEEDG
ncbi:hypothetical protein [Streptomyces noursei]|uniref:hypothetical protein n=1 Tax=Streptomyces noursei TaxID=1971 RepID=UPI003820ADA2